MSCVFPVGNMTQGDHGILGDYMNSTGKTLQTMSKGCVIAAYLLMALGVVGHSLNLVVLRRAPALQNSHFNFYQYMAVAELVYCVTFFLSQILLWGFFVPFRNGYRDASSAYFDCNLARFIYSSCGYIVLYMALMISVDRYAAVWHSASYRKLNSEWKARLTKILTRLALVLGTGFHSWSAFVDHEIVRSYRMPGNRSAHFSTPVFICRLRRAPKTYMDMKQAKDLYNITVRLLYPVLLFILTAGVILGLLRYKASRASVVSMTNQRRGRRRSEKRRERYLFYLMTIVAFLALIQVIPVEIKRVLYHMRHANGIERCFKLFKEKRLSYGHAAYTINLMILIGWIRFIANLVTQIDRSLKFYLYVGLNRQFRKQALQVLSQGQIGSSASVHEFSNWRGVFSSQFGPRREESANMIGRKTSPQNTQSLRFTSSSGSRPSDRSNTLTVDI